MRRIKLQLSEIAGNDSLAGFCSMVLLKEYPLGLTSVENSIDSRPQKPGNFGETGFLIPTMFTILKMI